MLIQKKEKKKSSLQVMCIYKEENQTNKRKENSSKAVQ